MTSPALLIHAKERQMQIYLYSMPCLKNRSSPPSLTIRSHVITHRRRHRHRRRSPSPHHATTPHHTSSQHSHTGIRNLPNNPFKPVAIRCPQPAKIHPPTDIHNTETYSYASRGVRPEGPPSRPHITHFMLFTSSPFRPVNQGACGAIHFPSASITRSRTSA